MQKFILLFRGSDVYLPDQSPEALQQLTDQMMIWVGGLMHRGQHVSSEKFKRTGQQLSGIPQTMQDQPYGDPTERLGGCTIILAADMDEAIAIAKACPILSSHASIEIRSIESV